MASMARKASASSTICGSSAVALLSDTIACVNFTRMGWPLPFSLTYDLKTGGLAFWCKHETSAPHRRLSAGQKQEPELTQLL